MSVNTSGMAAEDIVFETPYLSSIRQVRRRYVQNLNPSEHRGSPSKESGRPFFCGHGLQFLKYLYGLNLVPQTSPASQHFRIFVSGLAGLLGVPVAKQHIGLAAAVEKIAAVSVFRDNCRDLANG